MSRREIDHAAVTYRETIAEPINEVVIGVGMVIAEVCQKIRDTGYDKLPKEEDWINCRVMVEFCNENAKNLPINKGDSAESVNRLLTGLAALVDIYATASEAYSRHKLCVDCKHHKMGLCGLASNKASGEKAPIEDMRFNNEIIEERYILIRGYTGYCGPQGYHYRGYVHANNEGGREGDTGDDSS